MFRNLWLNNVYYETPADGGDGGDGDGGNADLTNQLAESNRQIAREQALRKFPTLTEDLMADISGEPAQILAYAERMHNRIVEAATPAPSSEVVTEPAGAPTTDDAGGAAPASSGGAVPTPVPGVGAAPTPGSQEAEHFNELYDKVLRKTATRDQRGFSEAEELTNLSLQRGLNELQAARR